VRRAAAALLLVALAGAVSACGKYGPPLRAEKSDAPAASESEKKSEASQ
jgi:predicted small lipoprotein YifL